MTAKEFLTQAYRIEDRITSLKRQLLTLQGGMKAPNYNNTGGGRSSTVNNETERRGIKSIELEEKIKREVERLEQVQLDIYNAIEGLENVDERLVLRYRYIELSYEGKQPCWDVIAYKMHYSTKQTVRIHGKALEHLIF